MEKHTERTYNLMIALVALAGALAPVTAAATGGGRLVDLPAERRMVVSLGAADSADRVAHGEVGRPVTLRVPRSAILHRFVGELVDAEGRRVGGPVQWTATVGSGAVPAMARLTSGNAVVSIPRPYGVRFEEGEELVVVADVAAAAGEGTVLRLSLEYEMPELAKTRRAVQAFSAAGGAQGDAREAGATIEGSWTWTSESDGRLVAITGRQLAGAGELVLEDARTGSVIWRIRSGPSFADVGDGLGETIRPGVRVEAGRTYRIRVVRPDADDPMADAPMMLMVPSRRSASGEF